MNILRFINRNNICTLYSDKQLDKSLPEKERAEAHVIAKYMAIGIATCEIGEKNPNDLPAELVEYLKDFGVISAWT